MKTKKITILFFLLAISEYLFASQAMGLKGGKYKISPGGNQLKAYCTQYTQDVPKISEKFNYILSSNGIYVNIQGFRKNIPLEEAINKGYITLAGNGTPVSLNIINHTSKDIEIAVNDYAILTSETNVEYKKQEYLKDDLQKTIDLLKNDSSGQLQDNIWQQNIKCYSKEYILNYEKQLDQKKREIKQSLKKLENDLINIPDIGFSNENKDSDYKTYLPYELFLIFSNQLGMKIITQDTNRKGITFDEKNKTVIIGGDVNQTTFTQIFAYTQPYEFERMIEINKAEDVFYKKIINNVNGINNKEEAEKYISDFKNESKSLNTKYIEYNERVLYVKKHWVEYSDYERKEINEEIKRKGDDYVNLENNFKYRFKLDNSKFELIINAFKEFKDKQEKINKINSTDKPYLDLFSYSTNKRYSGKTQRINLPDNNLISIRNTGNDKIHMVIKPQDGSIMNIFDISPKTKSGIIYLEFKNKNEKQINKDKANLMKITKIFKQYFIQVYIS